MSEIFSLDIQNKHHLFCLPINTQYYRVLFTEE
jgi:hypothetical protein